MRMKRYIIPLLPTLLAVAACADFLEPLPNGSYNEENYEDYPSLVRGYVEKAYALRPSTYISMGYIGADGLADNMTWRSRTAEGYKMATGVCLPSDNPLSAIYKRDYTGIYYCNLFLKDDQGLNTRYMVDKTANRNLQRALQGDAYALRAWYLYDLLKWFGGRGAQSGALLGVPLMTGPMDPEKADMRSIERAPFEDCIAQVVSDCDSAIKYLPLGNRDFLKEEEMIPVLGAVRYRRMDGASAMALKALVLLTWASPAYNTSGDLNRWHEAALAAKKAIDYKLDTEGVVTDGFDPSKPFMWLNPNAQEAYYISQISSNSTYETAFYPQGFNGEANYGPTQELVDAFPMANGYPIDRPEGGYDPADPYAGRDPRFYEDIFYDGARVARNTNASDIMYTFNTAEGGADAPGRVNTSPTGYYIRKFVYTGWNKADNSVETAQHCIFFLRWTHMVLAFAEAANNVVGPLDSETYGLSAKDALAYIRNRPTESGAKGIGAAGDPYLEECAARGFSAFDALVKNEWRIETCFEGYRFHNIRRWAKDVSEINVPLHRIKIEQTGESRTYAVEELERRQYPSLWMPLPYTEMRKAPLLEQNEGWETWR